MTKCHLHSSVVLSKLNRHDEALRCLGQVHTNTQMPHSVLNIMHVSRVCRRFIARGGCPSSLCSL